MTTDLGRVSLVGKGEYSATTQYERLDVVRYNGAAYLVLADVKGVTPAAGANYMLLVEDGEQGAQGSAGADGTNGSQGPAGPGVPPGGAEGQILMKKSDTNYDTQWINPPESDGELPEGLYAVRLQASDSAGGTLEGGGLVFDGVTATIKAEAGSGYKFKGWLENSEIISAESEYKLHVQSDRTLTADFQKYVLSWWNANALKDGASEIAYGDGTFVALGGNSNKCAYMSTSDEIWTESTTPVSPSYYRSSAYGDGVFIAIPYGLETTAIRSTDQGRTWAKITLPNPLDSWGWNNIAYGNGVFILTMMYAKQFAYSTNKGATWTSSTEIPFGSQNSPIAYGDGTFVVLSSSEPKAAYSTDGGKTWKESELPVKSNFASLTYGDGMFYSVSFSDNIAVYSKDSGKSWSSISVPFSSAKISYGNGVFFALQAGMTKKAFYSTDKGQNWIQSNLPFGLSRTCSGIAYGGGIVAIAYQEGIVLSYA